MSKSEIRVRVTPTIKAKLVALAASEYREEGQQLSYMIEHWSDLTIKAATASAMQRGGGGKSPAVPLSEEEVEAQNERDRIAGLWAEWRRITRGKTSFDGDEMDRYKAEYPHLIEILPGEFSIPAQDRVVPAPDWDRVTHYKDAGDA